MIRRQFTKSLLILLVAYLSVACSRHAASAVEVEIAREGIDVQNAAKLIDTSPNSAAGYVQLASAYIRRCRETGNVEYNIKAEKIVDRARELEPTNVAAKKLKATLMLSFHRFADGLALAKELQAELPDDAFVYGLLVDAHNELGDYDAAVGAAQKMVDLKPNAPAYSRIGHIRSLHGDTDGAIQAFKLAARMTDPADRESQTWCMVQIGNEYWRNGRYDQATRAFDEALAKFPDYYLALAGKGRVLASSGDLVNAVPLLSAAQAKHLNLDTIILLGDVYAKLGENEKAIEQYVLAQSGEQALGTANDPHRVALFWADHRKNLEQVVEIARADYANQKDIYASDTLAWCLYRAGRFEEAKRYISEAMRIGTADAKILYHAGMIEKSNGNAPEARQLLDRALKLNPGFDVFLADEARAALGELKPKMASTQDRP